MWDTVWDFFFLLLLDKYNTVMQRYGHTEMPKARTSHYFHLLWSAAALWLLFISFSPRQHLYAHVQYEWVNKRCWHTKHLRETHPICSPTPPLVSLVVSGDKLNSCCDRQTRNVCQNNICDWLEEHQAGLRDPEKEASVLSVFQFQFQVCLQTNNNVIYIKYMTCKYARKTAAKMCM